MTRLRRALFVLLPAMAALGGYSQTAVHTNDSPGEIARGEAIFIGKGGCLQCHRVSDRGSYMGPDLSAAGNTHTPAELRRWIVSPGAEVSPQNRLYRVITDSGTVITGRLLNQNTSVVQMLTSEPRLVTFSKSSLRSFGFTETAPMPSYRDKLSAKEQDEVVAYLTSLQGVVKQ